MMLMPKPEVMLECERCTRSVDPRCGGYWFLLLSPRGRCRMPHATEGRAVLCLGCGLQLREYLQGNAYTLAPAYDNEGLNWKGERNVGNGSSKLPSVSDRG